AWSPRWDEFELPGADQRRSLSSFRERGTFDKPLLTLVGPARRLLARLLLPHRGPLSRADDCAPRPAGRFSPGTLQGRLLELTELGLRLRSIFRSPVQEAVGCATAPAQQRPVT